MNPGDLADFLGMVLLPYSVIAAGFIFAVISLICLVSLFIGLIPSERR